MKIIIYIILSVGIYSISLAETYSPPPIGAVVDCQALGASVVPLKVRVLSINSIAGGPAYSTMLYGQAWNTPTGIDYGPTYYTTTANLLIYYYDRTLDSGKYAYKFNAWNVTPTNDPADYPSACGGKSGQSVYDLKSNISESTPLPAISCNEGCQVTSEVLWTQCINDSIDCLSSVKYTYNGNSCSNGDPSLNDGLVPTPPNNCSSQIADKIAECGGSLNISSYNFENCSGTCVPDPCHEKWLALVNKCGGIMAVSNWNSQTCTGVCANDPIVNPVPVDPNTQTTTRPPDNINSNIKYNNDGSKEVTQSVTNNYTDGTSVTTNTTTIYNTNGDQVSQTITTSSTHGTTTIETGTGTGTGEEDDDETYTGITPSGFGTKFDPGEFDIPARFTTFINNVKSSPLFSFSNGFFNSLPGGGSPIYEIDAGQYGHHTIDLSQTMSTSLAVLKTILLACFGFLSIRAVIMKR